MLYWIKWREPIDRNRKWKYLCHGSSQARNDRYCYLPWCCNAEVCATRLSISLFSCTNCIERFLVLYFNSVTEDFKVNPGAVECISEQPNNPDHILIGYTRGLLVLWNRKTLSADQVNFLTIFQTLQACWHFL